MLDMSFPQPLQSGPCGYFHCFQPPTYSWITAGASAPHLTPAPLAKAWQGFCGLFLAPQTCSVLQRHGLASLNTLSCPLHTSSCVHLSWLNYPLCCRGLCVLLAPQAHPLCQEVLEVLESLYDSHSQHSGPTLFFAGLLVGLFTWAHHLIIYCVCELCSLSIFWPLSPVWTIFQDYAPPWFHL